MTNREERAFMQVLMRAMVFFRSGFADPFALQGTQMVHPTKRKVVTGYLVCPGMELTRFKGMELSKLGQGLLGIICPAEELARGLLVILTKCLKESCDFLAPFFRLSVGLQVVTGGETHCHTQRKGEAYHTLHSWANRLISAAMPDHQKGFFTSKRVTLASVWPMAS